jgi:thiol-disulfide isomerase/thioredoxin
MTTRRRLLAGAGVAAVGTLAGCVGTLTDTSGDAGDDTTATADESESGLTLDTLAVGGSPGGTVPVAPDRVTLLDFFATWCAPCKPQMAELRAVHDAAPEVHLLSITSERDTAAIEDFWRRYRGTWPVARDPDLRAATEYGAGRVPTLVLLDADGSERWRHSGLAAAASIRREIAAVRDGG